MKNIENEQLQLIIGGISGTLINSIVKAIDLIYNLGKTVGSSLKRYITKKYCS